MPHMTSLTYRGYTVTPRAFQIRDSKPMNPGSRDRVPPRQRAFPARFDAHVIGSLNEYGG